MTVHLRLGTWAEHWHVSGMCGEWVTGNVQWLLPEHSSYQDNACAPHRGQGDGRCGSAIGCNIGTCTSDSRLQERQPNNDGSHVPAAIIPLPGSAGTHAFKRC